MQPRNPSSALRILVVEDLHDSADSLALLLRLWGYESVVAYDGLSALDMASAHSPDVVLLDIGLPGMDGCEAARQLRQLPGMDKALLLAITGYGHKADIQRCKEAGIDSHFLKPVDPAELQQVLRRAEQFGRKDSTDVRAPLRVAANRS
ncbi:MAG TPA: response regulator [Gemmataceae bacterium]|jgi:CheY-like chemotaxis protein